MSIVKEYVKSNRAEPEGQVKELVVDMLDRSRSSGRIERSNSSGGDLPNIMTQKQNFVSKTDAPSSAFQTGNHPKNWNKIRPSSANKKENNALDEFTNHEVQNILTSRKKMMTSSSQQFPLVEDKLLMKGNAWQDST